MALELHDLFCVLVKHQEKTCSRVQTSFDGTVVTCPLSSTECNERSSAFPLYQTGHFPTLNLAVWRVTGTHWCLSHHPSWIRKWFSELLRLLGRCLRTHCLGIELIDSFMCPAFSLKALISSSTCFGQSACQEIQSEYYSPRLVA